MEIDMSWTTYEFEDVTVTLNKRTMTAEGVVNVRYTIHDPDRSVGEMYRYAEIEAYDDIEVDIYDEEADITIGTTVKPGHPMHDEIILQLDEDFILEKCMEDD
jgi:hypothetical protein